MKAIILAGGFAKRMWPLTKEKPKHLLPIAGRPMLDHVLTKFDSIDDLDEIFISTNARFEEHFKKYLRSVNTNKTISLFIEDTLSEGEKLGSVGALGFLLRQKKIDDELIVIGGDNLFEFEMIKLIDNFRSNQANIVALYNVGSIEKARLYGVVDVNDCKKIIGFQEKPKEPKRSPNNTNYLMNVLNEVMMFPNSSPMCPNEAK